MTSQELETLTFFRSGERLLNGKIIDWNAIDVRTMRWIEELRRELDSPIQLIRGAHPGKPTAVDWCCPGVSFKRVAMALMRLPECSWGLYSGCSVHVDMRAYERLPARWLAVKTAERGLLRDDGLDGLITGEADGWIYLSWRYEKSLDALALVVALSEGKRRLSGEE